jgi:NAD-dependent SIR2 family protein deacetylase|tara:strand:- start:13291 stop:13536 length:246 start_codon:yes stop_codon:yes gene_type:complete
VGIYVITVFATTLFTKRITMRCIACDKLLSDYESTRKSEATGEFVDLCNYCYSTISKDIIVTEREDLLTPDNFYDDDSIDQ